MGSHGFHHIRHGNDVCKICRPGLVAIHIGISCLNSRIPWKVGKTEALTSHRKAPVILNGGQHHNAASIPPST